MALLWSPAGGGCWHWHWDTMYNGYNYQGQSYIISSKNTTACAVRPFYWALELRSEWPTHFAWTQQRIYTASPWHHSMCSVPKPKPALVAMKQQQGSNFKEQIVSSSYCVSLRKKFRWALDASDNRNRQSWAWALEKSLMRPSFFQVLYFQEIRNKRSHWPGCQSAPRLYNHSNLCPCARPAHLG